MTTNVFYNTFDCRDTVPSVLPKTYAGKCLPLYYLKSIHLVLYHKAKKLNPLRARWTMEPALISGFCSIKRMRVWFLLDGTLIHRRLANSWYLPTFECVSGFHWSALEFSQTFASVSTRLWRHGKHVLFNNWWHTDLADITEILWDVQL